MINYNVALRINRYIYVGDKVIVKAKLINPVCTAVSYLPKLSLLTPNADVSSHSSALISTSTCESPSSLKQLVNHLKELKSSMIPSFISKFTWCATFFSSHHKDQTLPLNIEPVQPAQSPAPYDSHDTKDPSLCLQSIILTNLSRRLVIEWRPV